MSAQSQAIELLKEHGLKKSIMYCYEKAREAQRIARITNITKKREEKIAEMGYWNEIGREAQKEYNNNPKSYQK